MFALLNMLDGCLSINLLMLITITSTATNSLSQSDCNVGNSSIKHIDKRMHKEHLNFTE